MSTTILTQDFTKPTRTTAARIGSLVRFRIEVILNSQDYVANTSNITINTYNWEAATSSANAGYVMGSGYAPTFKLYMNGTNVTNSVVDGYRFPRGTYSSYAFAYYATYNPTINSNFQANSYTTTVTHDELGKYSGTVRLDYTQYSSTASTVLKYSCASFTGTTYSFTLPELNQYGMKKSGSYIKGVFYIKVGGVWKKCRGYIKKNGSYITCN